MIKNINYKKKSMELRDKIEWILLLMYYYNSDEGFISTLFLITYNKSHLKLT